MKTCMSRASMHTCMHMLGLQFVWDGILTDVQSLRVSGTEFRQPAEN